MELEQVTQAVQGLIREMVREMGEKLMERIVQDKADVEQRCDAKFDAQCRLNRVRYRLDMQTSENKRLQQYMSALKAENTALQRKLTDFEERLASVEAEVGGEA
jgi:predicted nuclease with TOPRIM domain